MEKKLILLDSNSIVNRAYYALPPLTSKKGEPVGAVYGFINMLIKIISDTKPSHIAAVFDVKRETFRNNLYADYKAQRKPMPEDLREQIPILKDILRSMDINILEKEGYEADDVIGTVAAQSQIPVYIVTGDRDSLQLVSENTTVLLTSSNTREIKEVREDNIIELFELSASQIIDLKSLMGDASDNIPGVPGVGQKTAMSLLREYKTLEGVYDNIENIRGALKTKLEENKRLAELSYKLATIDTNVPISYDFENLRIKNYFNERAAAKFSELGFTSILKKIEKHNPDAAAYAENAEAFHSLNEADEVFEFETVVLKSLEQLKTVTAEIKKNRVLSFVYGKEINLAYDKSANYVAAPSQSFLDEGLSYEDLFAGLKDVLEDPAVSKITFDYKTVKHALKKEGITLRGLAFDVQLSAYMINSLDNFKTHRDLLLKYGLPEDSGAAGFLKLRDMHDVFFDGHEKIKHLYYNVDLPLVEVLFDMEVAGFSVDRQAMDDFHDKFTDRQKELTQAIYKLAGEEFNINSPKQLGDILFGKLGLPYAKKTKTGYSTDVDTLTFLHDRHPIVPLILDYRETAKLLGTYVDAMIPLIDAEGKIHTCFKQTISATGRVSSTEPNLQSIPVRKEESRELRRMFKASSGNTLVVADYSQIELRLLAAFSEDPVLISAFKEGRDIHAITASAAFGVPLGQVTADMRRAAKAVNFGIIYGISDFGLASDIGVTTSEAKSFIARYFETYPNVKSYMNKNVEFAKANGYVATFMGRIRRTPDINNKNFNLRSYNERIAMNMPLQGGASDIIKIAMLDFVRELKEKGLKAQLIMQVHDELIVDCPKAEADEVAEILTRRMETAADLPVKLVAEAGLGANWLEAK